MAGQAVGRVRMVVQEEGVVSGRAMEKREMLRGPLRRCDVPLQDGGVLPEAVDLRKGSRSGIQHETWKSVRDHHLALN